MCHYFYEFTTSGFHMEFGVPCCVEVDEPPLLDYMLDGPWSWDSFLFFPRGTGAAQPKLIGGKF